MADWQNKPWVTVSQRGLQPTSAQVAEAERELDKVRKDDSVWDTAVENEWAVPAAQRAIDRNTAEFAPTLGYEVPREVQDELAMKHGFDIAQEIVKESKSEEELKFNIANADADFERQKVLSRNGYKGVGAQLAASVLDPVGWGAAVVSAPVSGLLKLKRVGHIGQMALIGGMENAAIEALLNQGDYYRDVDDVFTAAGFGMIMGGTIGALTRNKYKGISDDIATPDARNDNINTVINGADEFDVAASKAVRDAMEYDAYMAARSYEPLRATDVDNAVSVMAHLDTLKANANVRMSGKDKGKLRSELANLETQREHLRQSKIDDVALRSSEVGVPKGKGEKVDLEVGKRVLARKYDEPINDITIKIDELKAKLDKVENVNKSKEELKRFSNLSREEQIKELGLDVKPRRIDTTSAVQAALKEIRDSKPKTPTELYEETKINDIVKQRDDTLSAARVKDSEIEGEQFDLSDRMDDLMTELANEAYQSPVKPVSTLGLGSVSSVLLNSKNPIFRGLGLRLLENSQGGAYHGKTASILSNVNGNLIRSAEKNRYNDGFSQFIKDNGMSPADFLNPAVTRDFNNQVYTAVVKGIPEDTPAGVKLAAEGISDKFKKALEIRKAAGEAGFEDVKVAKDYVPVIFDGIKVTEAINRLGSREGVEALISKGYQTGKYKMGKKPADALAKVQVLRASDATLSSRVSFDRVVSQQQQVQLIEELKSAGVPDNVINNFIDGVEHADMADAISNRAKASMGINTQAEYNGMRVQDVLNTNIGELAENYGKEAAGGAGLASMGFPTRQSIMNAIDAGERAGRNMLDKDSKAIKSLRSEAEMLRDVVRLLYGNTVDADPTSGIVRGTRRLREVTGLLRLGQMGFAQLPEVARSISKMGLGTVLESVPATKFLMSRKGRKGGTAQGELKEPELREMEELIGYIGEDNWLTGWNVRHDEFGETADNMSRISAMIDNGLAMGSRVNVWLSGFKAIQGGSEKIVARSINKRLKEHISGGRKLPTRDLEEVGLNEETMSRLQKHFEANPKYEEFNGKQVRMMNFEAMDADLRETVGVAVRRMSGRLIQRNFIGDEGIWMNKWWGKALSQFKSFSIVSIEKQLIHDLRGDKIHAAQILAWSSLLSYAAYATQMQMQAIGRADRDDFLREKFDNRNMAMGVFNKMPQVAGFGLAGDALATFGLLPDSLMNAPSRMGYRSQNFGDLVAGAGVIGDAVGLVQSFSKYATGDDDVSTRQLVDKVRRLVPLANTIGVGQMTKASVDLLED